MMPRRWTYLVKVEKKKGESTVKLISRFKRRVLDEEIIENAKEAAVYEKPSERRKKKRYRLEGMFEHKRSNEWKSAQLALQYW